MRASLGAAPSRAEVRIVREEEALTAFPAIWDEARRQRTYQALSGGSTLH